MPFSKQAACASDDTQPYASALRLHSPLMVGNSKYRAEATFDDGSCASRRRLTRGMVDGRVMHSDGMRDGLMWERRRRLDTGCMDATAINHDPTATVNAGCEYHVYGCTNSLAFNYLSSATAEQSAWECSFPIRGCSIAEDTLNFDSNAQQLEGCVYILRGCLDSTVRVQAPLPRIIHSMGA